MVPEPNEGSSGGRTLFVLALAVAAAILSGSIVTAAAKGIYRQVHDAVEAQGPPAVRPSSVDERLEEIERKLGRIEAVIVGRDR